jgi:hypothetical protein
VATRWYRTSSWLSQCLLARLELLYSLLKFLDAVEHLLFLLRLFPRDFRQYRDGVEVNPQQEHNQWQGEDPRPEIPGLGRRRPIRLQTFGTLRAFIAGAARQVDHMSTFQATSIRKRVKWFALYDFAVEYALVVQSSRLLYFLGMVHVAVILAAEHAVECRYRSCSKNRGLQISSGFHARGPRYLAGQRTLSTADPFQSHSHKHIIAPFGHGHHMSSVK